MASVLAGVTPPGRIDLAGDYLSGRSARQSVLAGDMMNEQRQFNLDRAPKVAAQNDAMAAQEQQINQQNIDEGQYLQAVQKARVINRLGKQMKPMSVTQRQQFKQSLSPELLQSLNIDPQQVAQFEVDDQSVDNLIAQTDAALSSIDQSNIPAEQRNRQALMEALQGGIDPTTGQLKPIDQLTAAQRAAANELGLTAAEGRTTARERIAADTGVTAQVAESEATIAGATSGAREGAKLDVQLDKLPQVKAAVTAAQERIKNEVEGEATAKKNSITLNMYETAMQGLSESLGATQTGPIYGLLPAVTANQQIAEGAVSALAPILKSLFRTAGEGTFTDKDQELLLRMVPTRNDLPEARAAKIANIDAIVRAKLGGAPPQVQSSVQQRQEQPQQGGQQGEPSIEDLVRQYAQ